MAGAAIDLSRLAEEDIGPAPTTGGQDMDMADRVMSMADRGTAGDTGLRRAQARVQAMYIRMLAPAVRVRPVHVRVVDARAARSLAEDVPGAVARAAPDNWQ